jgi:hypothetical protein
MKRSSLFSIPAAATSAPAVETTTPTLVSVGPPAAPEPEPQARKYPVAKTREGKRVATVYLEKEALRQLQKLAFDEETTIQVLLTEGVNSVFAARGLSRIA